MLGRSFSGGGSRPSHMSRLSCPSRLSCGNSIALPRRSFIRAGAGLAAIIAAGRAPAALIRSMLAARNSLLAGKRLPYDAEVEYLESTGTQWIDTGVKITVDCLFDFAVAKTRSNYNCVFFGTRNSGDGVSDNLQCYLNSNDYNVSAEYNRIKLYTTSVLNTSNWDSGVVPVINQMYEFVGAYCVPTMQTTTQTMPLFAFKTVNTLNTANCACRIGHWTVYTPSKVLRDFVPVRKGTVGYRYDRVSGKLFGNAGTGDFVLGPDIVPVEWLEGGQLNSGIAFIDTGYTPNSSTKIESMAAIFSSGGYSGRFGNLSRLTFGANDGRLYMAQGAHYYLSSYTVGTFCSFVNDIANRTVSVEGVGSTSTSTVSDWYPQLYPVYLFASNVAPLTSGTVVNGKQLDPSSLGRIRMKSCSIWENNIPVRSFRPVRVGTDATSWEGAMMDVLTRRIYRNAGTGAFTYGNDI